MRRRGSASLSFADMHLNSSIARRARQIAERGARLSTPLLIEGEPGVGKQLLARAIHAASTRRSRPFTVVRCSGLSASDLEALRGDCPSTKGGTLFLHDIGALPSDLQAGLSGLLSAKQNGANDTGSIGARIIAANSRRLVELVSEGRFREDLYYRLSTSAVWLPPLRDRSADIPGLALSLMARFAAQSGKSGVAAISAEATELLCAYDWRGNLRELKGAIHGAMMLCERSVLSPQDFPHLVSSLGSSSGSISHSAGGHVGVADEGQTAGGQQPSPSRTADRQDVARYGMARLLDTRGELRPFEALEEEVIRFALRHCQGRMSEAARRLGIGRSTLYRKIRGYGIEFGDAWAS